MPHQGHVTIAGVVTPVFFLDTSYSYRTQAHALFPESNRAATWCAPRTILIAASVGG